MKWKIYILLILIIGAAFYFGFLKFRTPTLQQVQQAIPVQVDPAKEKKITAMEDKTKNAVSAAKKELKKPDPK